MSKLLLVEDDNNLREIYEARLQAEGYTIVAARDGEEALAVAKSEKPDLIISDVMMPKISGFEMLDILKNTDGLKNVRVIMLTALGQSDDQQRADKLGADRYLVKSQVTLEDIVRVAHELLEDGGEAPAAPIAATPTPMPVASTSAPVAVATPPADPAPAVASVLTPATEPVTAPPPTVVPPADPTATTPASDDSSTNEAMSTSDEEAGIESQIEDFVSGASSDASSPAEASASATEPVTAPPPTAPVASTSAPTNDAASAEDEKLMNDTVNSLMNDSSSSEEAPAGATPDPVAPTDTAPAPAKAEGSSSGGSTMSHEKVINPPADREEEKKPDIQALFAAEQAKEASATNVPSAPVAAPTPAPVAPTPDPVAAPVAVPAPLADPVSHDKPIDPNSIAL